MDKKQFSLTDMRATARQLMDAADNLGQELTMRLMRIDNAELCLPPTQQGTLEDFTASIRTALNNLVEAEQQLAAGLRDAADVAEGADTDISQGFTAG